MKKNRIRIILIFLIINFSGLVVYGQGSGSALSFDGVNDYVDCGNIINLGNTDLVATISFWSKGSGRAISTERSSYSGTCGDGGVFVNASGTISYYSDYTTSLPYSITVSTTSTIDISKWNHIVVVIDGPNDTYTFYFNGIKEVKSLAFTMVNAVAFSNIEIGRHRNYIWGTTYFNGTLDEVRIWNRALSQTEIQENMCKKLTGTEVGLVAYYPMNEGIDNTCSGGEDVCDMSGNGNNGTKY